MACFSDPYILRIPKDLQYLARVTAERHLNWRPTDEDTAARVLNVPTTAQVALDDTLKGPDVASARQAMISVLVQVTGVLADEACTCCANGGGIWATCVVPPPGHGHKTAWACANCTRFSNRSTCSLYRKTEQLDRMKMEGKSFSFFSTSLV